jgi:pyruvate dehydrogenase E2 component (dihydrolipoamide acetyltransferase)
MATPVELPKLGNTVEECLLSRWVKRKGDAVAEGEVIAEIETDKTNFEITAPVAGTLLDTFFDEGALVPVFSNLCVIGSAGEDVESFRPGTTAPAKSETVADSGLRAPGSGPEAEATPEARSPESEARSSAPFSPRARKVAAEHKVQPAAVIGSGPGGRVLEMDVRRSVEGARGEGQGAIAPHPSPLTPTRSIIARRLRESLASTAQYTMNASADATGLLAARARNKASQQLAGVNINDLVTFCTIKALLDVPDLNAEYVNGSIVKHADVHIGFACDTPRGLMVPVVRNANALTAAQLAARMKELTAQAVKGTISPDDLSGATFTVSNLGAFGVESFTPLINPPQVAILGVGAIQLRAVRRNGSFAFVDAIGLSLTCDHQVVDGAPGARFLQVVKQKIENVQELV